ncbi:MAG: PAS domain S-box protein [Calditrichaeota bacterium]|nr:PAS domain S-box protein [Calditrichota bacterium]MCB0290010.1 PAS domain S-box protein [Calditrichota bacterium]MCB0296831.1 PAS domain S-box protein [Calditrichota bacterium]MCB0305273.1 PAS domain S-box protein [Calditrichota bacterium]
MNAILHDPGFWRTLLEKMPAGVCLISGREEFVYCNPAFCTMLGYREGALMGTPIVRLFPPQDGARAIERARDLLEGAEEFASRYHLIKNDGTQLPIEAFSQRILVNGDPILMSVVLDLTESIAVDEALRRSETQYRQLAENLEKQVARRTDKLHSVNQQLHQEIRERIEIEKDLKNSRERLRKLSIHQEAVRERERTRIARNIHDDLGQILSGMKMEMNWLKTQGRLPEPAAAKIESITALLKEAIRHVRKISQDLRPSVLDNLGLCAAISWQAAEFQQRSGIECGVSFTPDDIAVAEAYKVALFRIFQQTLTNIYQHAQATRVEIDLIQHLDSLCLNIKDNGIGIHEEDLSNPASFGLTSIRERVSSLNGYVDITGEPGKGTRITVCIPTEKGE